MVAPAWGLAFKIISCSLKGGQRGVWGSLEVKESQSLSQLLTKSATPWCPGSVCQASASPGSPSSGCLGSLPE